MSIDREAPFRPYAPPANVIGVLQRLRRMNTPARLTPEFLGGAGVADSLQTRVIAALRFLQLVDDDGRPSDTLRAIVVAPDEDYRKLLETAVRSAYQEEFGNVDPTVDPQPRILNAFQRYHPRSQHDRQVMLFLGLCREAGIPVLDAPRDRGMQDSSKKPARASSRKSARTRVTAPTDRSGGTTSSSGVSIEQREETPSGLLGLVGFVERDAEVLDEAEFDEVWRALGTVVGKVARARARARRRLPAADAGEFEDSDEA